MTNISFAVSVEQPFLTGKDVAKFKYASAEAAERAARKVVALKGGEMSIWTSQPLTIKGRRYSQLVATVLKDALDRTWTQVVAGPGQQAFL